MPKSLFHSCERDVEEGIGRSFEIENEENGTKAADDAASPFLASRSLLEDDASAAAARSTSERSILVSAFDVSQIGKVDAKMPAAETPSPGLQEIRVDPKSGAGSSMPADPKKILGGLGTARATGRATSGAEGSSGDASDIDMSRDINIGQLVAELSGADQNRRINLRELKDIMKAATENSVTTTGGGADATRLTRLPPAPEIQDDFLDEDSPFSVNFGVGGDLLPPSAKLSTLFANESPAQNTTTVSPLSRTTDSQTELNKATGGFARARFARGGLAQPRDFGDGPAPPTAIENEFGDDKISKKIRSAFPEEPARDIVGSLPPTTMLESITDPRAESNKARGGLDQPRDFGDGPAPPTAIENESGDDKISKKIRSAFPEEPARDIVGPLPPTTMLESITDPQVESKKARGGLDQPRDFGDGPAPPTAIEYGFGDGKISKKIRSAFPEQVQDLAGPDSFAASPFEDTNPTRKIRGRSTNEARNNRGRGTRVEPDELSPPVPFNFAAFGDPCSSALKAEEHKDIESNLIPKPDGTDRDVGPSSIRRPENVRNRDGGERPQSDTSNLGASSSVALVAANPPDDANAGSAPGTTPMVGRDQNESLLKIPEAFLVEESDDGEVFIATHVEPPLPLWKRKRVVCAAILFVAAVSATAAGASIASIRNSGRGVDAVTVSSPDSFPSVSPVPSSSSAPSSMPTACALTVSANAQKLEMPLSNPRRTKMRIEGRHAVVVSKESETENVHVIFYVLRADGWERGNHFIEDADLGRVTYGDEFNTLDDTTRFERVRVAFNGETALVGFPYADSDGKNSGTVFVYQRNAFGVWEKRDAPLAPQDDDSVVFGYSVDLDGDLACVISNPDYIFGGDPRVYIFRNDGSEWTQIRRLDLPYPPTAEECFVSGDTVAVQINRRRIDVYQFDSALDRYERLQEPLIISDQFFSISFSRELLVYLTGIRLFSPESGECYVQKNSFIHGRQDVTRPYTFREQINSTRNDECVSPDFQAAMSLDRDIMVLGGSNQTRLLLQSNGYWEEALALDQSYHGYAISGRNLLALVHNDTTSQDEIHYFDIEDCALSPTQMPSSSVAPSSSKFPTPSPSVEETFAYTPTGGFGYVWLTLPPTEGETRPPFAYLPTKTPTTPFPTYTPTRILRPAPVTRSPSTPLRPTTPFPTWPATTESRPTPVTRSPATPLPTPFTTRHRCPEASLVGCTAPDPSDPVDECPTVGEPCPDFPGEYCCRDACPRNYCTSKRAQERPTPQG